MLIISLRSCAHLGLTISKLSTDTQSSSLRPQVQIPHPGLTEHLVLHRAVGIIQMQEELLEDELQVRGTELGAVFFSQTGQPQSEGLKGDAAHLLAAVVKPLQQLWREKTATCKTLIHRKKQKNGLE